MRHLSLFIFLLLSISGYSQTLDYLPTSTTGQVIHHSHYTLSYSEKHEQAEWVAYKLTAGEVNGSYKGSGYDRGHLAPAGDMSFSHTAMGESFYLSNMSPQEAGFKKQT